MTDSKSITDPKKVNHYSGSCLCGSIKYEITGQLREVVNCHCEQCRKSHGHYAAYTAAKREQITMIEDRGLSWYESSSNARRGFCYACGSSLFWDPYDKDYLCISAGSLDKPTGLSTVKHVYVSVAGDYYQIVDDLEQHPESMESI